MRLLWIATKAPWPPRDGGRLLLFQSLAALAARGTRVTLVAPVTGAELPTALAALAPVCDARLVVSRPRARILAALTAAVSRRPYSLTRHARPALELAVARELDAGGVRLVVAEQLQAFPQTSPAAVAGIPRLLRAQNVESDLWRQVGESSRGFARSLLLRESARLADAERAAVRNAAMTLALSLADGERLQSLAGAEARVEVVPPPFPGELPVAEQRLAGSPALVLFGSAGWEPNRRAEERYVSEYWPRIRAANPAASLHWFGGAGPARAGVFLHPPPRSSAEAFAPGAILVLPLDIASGVRMRILEAWARGVVIVATPAAASGLNAHDGRELLLARNGEEFAVAIERLAAIPGLAERLIAGGRARLASDHSPERFAARFDALAERFA
ncbi:MAG: glycosyltransferase [Thermoanaerobaculia bacterium]